MTDQQTIEPRPGSLRAWVNDLGYVRRDGWVGGVAAAVARRIGVDPLIVRGAFVVATLAWFPALWAYAFAWAMMPDAEGRFPFARGRSAAGVLVAFALAALATIGKLPVIAVAMSRLGAGVAVLPMLVWLGFVGAVVAGLVWLARRGTPDLPLSEGIRGEAVGASATGGAASGTAPPTDFDAPPSPDASGDMEAWRAQYADWRRRHNDWRIQQGEDPAVVERELRQRQQEAFRAESARIRAARRAANPRTSLSFIGIAVGAALLAAGATGAAVIAAYGVETAVTAGALAGSAVLAIAMIVAGILRRRSGFLAFVTVVALVVGGSGVARAALEDFVLPGASRYPGDEQLTIYQPFGYLYLGVESWRGGEGATTVTKGSGELFINIQPDVDVVISANLVEGEVILISADERGEWTERSLDRGADGNYHWTVDAENEKATRTIAIAQSSGTVRIQTPQEEQ